MRPIVIIDSNYLCRRAQYTTGGMEFNGTRTGVLYGFLKEVATLRERFNRPATMVFCFDSIDSKRKSYCPSYKKSRDDRIRNMSKPEYVEESHFRDQLETLRDDILPQLGFNNVHSANGYEADDLIAKAVESAATKPAVIVSSDKDLYQLISRTVSIWNPAKKLQITYESFLQTFGIAPGKWAAVKAIAGCSSDDVAGVPGVGEATAVKYIRRELNVKSETWAKINRASERIQHNMKLVKLPFPGTPEIEIHGDEFSKRAWNTFAKTYGMMSLLGAIQ